MNNKILITYSTIHGSTKEIASNISETLRANGESTDLIPIRKVKGLEEFQGVILGAPLYMFKWHRDAFWFLKKFQPIFDGRLPVAIFAGGPTGKGDEEEWQVVRAQVDKELGKIPWLKPASVLLVGGKFDSNNLRFPYNLIPALKQLPDVDHRDWPAIESWAQSLPDIFQKRAEEIVK